MNLQSTISFLHLVALELRRLADDPYGASYVRLRGQLHMIADKLSTEANDLADAEEKNAQGR